MATMRTVERRVADIDAMPRGGPDASWLDRRLQTNCHMTNRGIIRGLEWTGERLAHWALDEVADVADPKFLELGAGHGALSRHLLRDHPTARVTISDVDPTSVVNLAATQVGSHPRATVRLVDAAEIDAPDRSFDLVVFAFSFHHLAPGQAAQVIAEGTRVGDKLLIVDLARPPSLLHIARLATMLPFAPVIPFARDGVISSLRAYSPSALRALAAHADPTIEVRLRGGLLAPQVMVARRV